MQAGRPSLSALPDLCKREVLSQCSPATFVRLRQVDTAWRSAATPYIMRCVVSAATGVDVTAALEDPATVERALRRLVRFEQFHTRRCTTLVAPFEGISSLQFSQDPAQLVGYLWGSHLQLWDLVHDTMFSLHEGVNIFQWGSDRSELYAGEECGSLFWYNAVGTREETVTDLQLYHPEIRLGLAVNHETLRFAAGGWGGFGVMGDLFDVTRRRDLPHAGEGMTAYDVRLVSDGDYVIHPGLQTRYRVTAMGDPNISYPLPDWIVPHKLRRLSMYADFDALLLDGGVAFVDFDAQLLEPEYILPPALDIIDMQPLFDSNTWVTLHGNRQACVWDMAEQKPRRIWRKRFREPLKRLWLGAAVSTFAIENQRGAIFLYTCRSSGCWAHGQLMAPSGSQIKRVDISEDSDFALVSLSNETFLLKRIAAVPQKTMFALSDPFSYIDRS